MDYIVKQASALTEEEKSTLGISGIPDNWPIEIYPYVGDVPTNFTLMSQEEYELLKINNQAAYDAWVNALRPIITPVIQPQPVVVQSQPAFKAKTLPDGKKLFKRVTGIQQSLTIGQNIIEFVIPYDWIKLTGCCIINCEALDTADLYILDNELGSYSGVPNAMLNQFGFSVNLPKDFYRNESMFDADLYRGMVIKCVYTSVSNKTLGINILMDEVKS